MSLKNGPRIQGAIEILAIVDVEQEKVTILKRRQAHGIRTCECRCENDAIIEDWAEHSLNCVDTKCSFRRRQADGRLKGAPE